MDQMTNTDAAHKMASKAAEVAATFPRGGIYRANMHADVAMAFAAASIAQSLERIALALEQRPRADGSSPLPDPPEHLADAWRRYQKGEHVTQGELSRLDEWRDDCARDAGF